MNTCSTRPDKGRDRDPLSSNQVDVSARYATHAGSSRIVPIVHTQQLYPINPTGRAPPLEDRRGSLHRARLDCGRAGPRVNCIRVIFFRAAALLNLLAERVVPAPRPVLALTNRAAVASLASTALLGSFGVQRRRTGSTGREEVHVSIGS